VTHCRFVNDSLQKLIRAAETCVLHVTDTGQASKLDMTYSPVLKPQVINIQGCERCDIVESFRLIVSTTVTLTSPLPKRVLAHLLDVHISKVTTTLCILNSASEVPENLDSNRSGSSHYHSKTILSTQKKKRLPRSEWTRNSLIEGWRKTACV
jgi:hypothetical protein